jgi:hypothetical protein
LLVRLVDNFGVDENSGGFPQKYPACTMGFAGCSTYIPMDSMAIFVSPTSESSLFSGRARLAAMGISDERRVLFAALDDGGDRVRFGDQRHLREVTRIAERDAILSHPLFNIFQALLRNARNAFAG